MSNAHALYATASALATSSHELDRYIDASHHHWVALAISGAAGDAARSSLRRATAVSYTHLTLPTKRIV